MDKPNITKIIHTRHIGRNKNDYDIEEHSGYDDKGIKWNWLAYRDIKSGKIVDTRDYREVK